MSFIDIAIIVLVALGALIGLWKGFFKTIISFFGWFVSFLIAFFLTKVVAEALLDVSAIRGFVLGTGESWSLLKWVTSFLPADVASASGVWGLLLKPILSIAQSSGAALDVSVAILVANGIFNIMVCLGLFIAIRIVLMLFTMFANAITQNKAIGAFNRFLGFIVGAAKGLGFVGIIFIVLSFFIGTAGMTGFRNELDKSILGKPISQTVFKLTDKFWSADGNLMDKLLDFAGIDKDDAEEPPVAEPTAEREALKAQFDKLLYNSGFGELDSAAFDAMFNTSDATLDGYTANMKQYFTNAGAKLASAQPDVTADTYKAMLSLISANEQAEDGVIYTAFTQYLSAVKSINLALAENSAADVTTYVAAANAAKDALSLAVAASADFSGLFGTFTFVTPEAPAPVQQSQKQKLTFALNYLSFTPFAA